METLSQSGLHNTSLIRFSAIHLLMPILYLDLSYTAFLYEGYLLDYCQYCQIIPLCQKKTKYIKKNFGFCTKPLTVSPTKKNCPVFLIFFFAKSTHFCTTNTNKYRRAFTTSALHIYSGGIFMTNYPQFKSVDELTFTDDFMFGTIMKNKTICKGVLERLLHIKVGRIEYPVTVSV